MSKIYLVCEYTYEYNDEIYYRPESDSVGPLVAFTDPEKANDLCLQKNLEWLKELVPTEKRYYSSGLDDYGYEVDDVISNFTVFEELIEKYGLDLNLKDRDTLEYIPGFIIGLTKDDQKRALSALNTIGYVVREVESR